MVAKKTAVRKTSPAAPDDKPGPVRRAPEEPAERVVDAPAARKTPGKSVGKAPGKTAGTTAGKKAAGKAAEKAAPAAPRAAEAARQTGADTVTAKKTADVTSADASGAPEAGTAGTAPGELAVRPGEDPWSPEEVAEARAVLLAEVTRLEAEITASEQALSGLMRDSGDGAGQDEADTGTKNVTREHELAIAANARATLEQAGHALQRLDAGTYGLCEVCGKPIGKARMQAFPRATLCVEDKQKQERRG
ncbi:TraR/DksA family transcriptional regulator [Streptomyces sp. LP05-1]|uniref:TraR/DksA family transcriptional regulator n=1 Tax=Streptomyces pyxinae TaxID=2970734 RepID=A0ABT2CG67_9ACTN|nr:TraR/DksA family transcriptional regulator [Streptomyces sp. LP05-1]MCS0636412.1 TraR/DksA family transcriptional regulator [Streptomyces sp. LP05-1]